MNLAYLFAAVSVIVVVLWIGTAIYLRIKEGYWFFEHFSSHNIEASRRARHGVTMWLEVLQESERFLPKSLAGSRKMLTFAALTSFIHLNLNAYESKNEEKLCEIWQNAW